MEGGTDREKRTSDISVQRLCCVFELSWSKGSGFGGCWRDHKGWHFFEGWVVWSDWEAAEQCHWLCILPDMPQSLHVIPAVIRAFWKQMAGWFCVQLLHRAGLTQVVYAEISQSLFLTCSRAWMLGDLLLNTQQWPLFLLLTWTRILGTWFEFKTIAVVIVAFCTTAIAPEKNIWRVTPTNLHL